VDDTGTLTISGEKIAVLDTKKENDLIIHFTEKLPVDQEARVIASVDREKRRNIAIHHTATHLLHAALRKVLGAHVAQKGSLVNAEHLRFDFSHFTKVSDQEISEIEKTVNEKIRENIPVDIREMPRDEALKLGAMALFGEKYGDVVRVVTIDPAYSVELCGGTHVMATGELGFFKIKSESAVAAGVRRIEAVAGTAAEVFIGQELNILASIRDQLKNPKDLLKSLQDQQTETGNLRKKLESQEMKQAARLKSELLEKIISVDKYFFIGEIIDGISPDTLRKLTGELRAESQSLLLALATISEGKAFISVGVGDRLVSEKNLDASKLIKEMVAPAINGGGGGQKTLASASGHATDAVKPVLLSLKALL
jgi:alanyl-tRNA synthetase